MSNARRSSLGGNKIDQTGGIATCACPCAQPLTANSHACNKGFDQYCPRKVNMACYMAKRHCPDCVAKIATMQELDAINANEEVDLFAIPLLGKKNFKKRCIKPSTSTAASSLLIVPSNTETMTTDTIPIIAAPAANYDHVVAAAINVDEQAATVTGISNNSSIVASTNINEQVEEAAEKSSTEGNESMDREDGLLLDSPGEEEAVEQVTTSIVSSEIRNNPEVIEIAFESSKWFVIL